MKLMMILTIILCSLAAAQAAEVCVIAYYGEGNAESRCVDVPEGTDGYEVLEATGWNMLWTPDSEFGQMVCRINSVGTDVNSISDYCEYYGDYWNFVLEDNDEWGHSPIGLNGGDKCWNRDFSYADWTSIVHYCARDGDLIGFAFGDSGAEPYMLHIKDIKVEVDGKKESSADEDGGKIDVEPGSKIELSVELENLYSDDIDMEDVYMEGEIDDLDLDDETDERDLSPEKEKTFRLDFQLPIYLDDDDYELTLNIYSQDTYGIEYNKEIQYDIEVDREKHEITLSKLEVTPDLISCRDTFAVVLDLLNIGEEDEDVTLSLQNDQLAINQHDSFELEEGEEVRKSYSFVAQEQGDYPIDIQIHYADKNLQETVTITKEDCGPEDMPVEEESPEDSDVIILEQETSDPTGMVTLDTQDKDKTSYLGIGVLIIGIILAVLLIVILSVKN